MFISDLHGKNNIPFIKLSWKYQTLKVFLIDEAVDHYLYSIQSNVTDSQIDPKII